MVARVLMGEPHEFVCPGCGQGFTSVGSYNLHKPVEGKCGGGPAWKGRQDKSKKKKRDWAAQPPESSACSQCGGTLRLLSSSNPRESKAMTMGYSVVCKKCLELYK